MKKTIILLYLISFKLMLTAQVDLGEGLEFYLSFESAIEDLANNTSITNHGELMIVENNQLSNSLNAVQFSGEASFLELNQSSSFSADSDYAFSFWFKAPENQISLNSTANALISKWILENGDHDNKGYPFAFRIYNQDSPNNGKLALIEFDGLESDCNNVSQIITENTYNDNLYHHVFFGKSQNKLRLYVDCVFIGEIESEATCSIANEANIFIGARNESFSFDRPNNFKGEIDELRIYNRYLDYNVMQL